MVNALSERFGYPVSKYSDTSTAFRDFRQVAVAGAARAFMMPPYHAWSRPWGTDEATPVSDVQPWVQPTEEELRSHLLKSWPEAEVDAHMASRAAIEAARVARERWESSWRGQIVTSYRRVLREAGLRVRESWRVLQHGIRDEGEF